MRLNSSGRYKELKLYTLILFVPRFINDTDSIQDIFSRQKLYCIDFKGPNIPFNFRVTILRLRYQSADADHTDGLGQPAQIIRSAEAAHQFITTFDSRGLQIHSTDGGFDCIDLSRILDFE